MIGNLFPPLKMTREQDVEKTFNNEITLDNHKTVEFDRIAEEEKDEDEWQIPAALHRLGQEDSLDKNVQQDIKAIFHTTMMKTKKTFSKQYIPLGSIMDNAYLKQHEIRNFHFEHIYLNSTNSNSCNKVVFRHNEQTKEIRFYIPTFLRFSLIKLHSEDLKNITHIQNKNNLIIYINVYTRGLPKMLIDKLTKRTKSKDGEEEAKLLFRANRHLFEAKYYTSYNGYLIFMFNPFSDNMVEFEIMKNVMFAPFEQAELILHIRINKKVFKLERSKTLKIAKSCKVRGRRDIDSPIYRERTNPTPQSSASIQDRIDQESQESSEEQQFDILQFNKIIMQFKLEKPKNVADSFRFHKSIEFGNYGIMTNEINIHVGNYESPEKKKQLEEERQRLNIEEQDLHEQQLEDVSSLRLSIGLYKHPVTELCTFFIPLMLAGGLTLLLFHLCDHNLTNQLQVLAIILVAYGAFIPQFRQRISMSRTVIFVDLFILYNMVPAILCALQSIAQSKHKQTYNIYQVISVIMYYGSILFLGQIYLLYMYVDRFYFKKHTKQMVHNFDTDIFETHEFQVDKEKNLSWFMVKGQKDRAFFCEKQQQPQPPHKKIRFTRKQTRYQSRVQEQAQQQIKRKDPEQLAESVALEIRMSATTNKTLHEVKESPDEEGEQKHEQHEYLYRTKVIQNQRHIHSFQKILSTPKLIIGVLIIAVIMAGTLWLSWKKIIQILNFEDLNKNCIHDQQEAQRLGRIQTIINKQSELSKLISQTWNEPSVPVPISDVAYDHIGKRIHKAAQTKIQPSEKILSKNSFQSKKHIRLNKNSEYLRRHHQN